jgi:predicted RNA methylase
MKISDEVLQVLNNSRIEGNKLFLPPGLERKLYVKTNDALTSIGAIWNKKLKCHLSDTDIEEKLEEIINTGEYNSLTEKKNDLNFFETPPNIAADLVMAAKIGGNHKVLEPSCGKGRIVKELLIRTPDVDVVEIDQDNFDYTITKYNCCGHVGDFLNESPEEVYDRIVMNPPFSKGREVLHILHAWKFLKPGGILVSIVSESPFFREDSSSREFRNWILENNGETIKLPPGSFKTSGTLVNTRILKIKK